MQESNSNNQKANESALVVSKADPLADKVRKVIFHAWNPVPIPKPVIDPSLPESPFLERTALALNYQLLKLEYALSSGGGLRSWLKLNLLIAIVLAIPAIFVVPVVTLILASFAKWTDYFRQMAYNLMWTVLYLVFTAVVVGTVIYAYGQIRGKGK